MLIIVNIVIALNVRTKLFLLMNGKKSKGNHCHTSLDIPDISANREL